MKRLYNLHVRGKSGAEYSLPLKLDEAIVPGLRADGLDLWRIVYRVPVWAVNLGLLRPWISIQGAWQWLRLF